MLKMEPLATVESLEQYLLKMVRTLCGAGGGRSARIVASGAALVTAHRLSHHHHLLKTCLGKREQGVYFFLLFIF